MAESPLKAVIVPVTPFQQNCTLLWCTETMRGAFVDPGGDVDRLKQAAAEQGVRIEKILLTHGHLDHAGAAARLARDYGVKIEGPHRGDEFLLSALAEQAVKWNLPGCEACRPDRWLDDGDEVTVGAVRFGVRHCPGHTPGHVVLYNRDQRIALVGDVLFAGSVGRTDLPGGSHQQLVESITRRLWPLGEDMRFVPGHGQMSTFGWERKTNPFVSDLAVQSVHTTGS